MSFGRAIVGLSLGFGVMTRAAPLESGSAVIDSSELVSRSGGFDLTEHIALHSRQSGCGERPDFFDDRALCGDLFPNMDQNGWVPALAAAPIFNFGRQDSNYGPCYPESARDLDTIDGPDPQPNKGTDAPNGMDPGKNCNSPGEYHGDFSAGLTFPVYVDWVHCDGDQPTWRINYNLYYPHDSTHKHDWEMVSVIWRKEHEDWWVRDSMAFSTHSSVQRYAWEDLVTVAKDGDWENREKDGGARRHFAKVYVGMWKNANFPDRKTSCVGLWCATNDDEYRSDDWMRQPVMEDLRVGSGDRGDIPNAWGEEGGAFSGKSTPNKRVDDACSW